MTLETASQPQPLPDGDTEKVCAITVTYGRRWHLLRQVIASARSEGLSEIIVIDNAAQDDIAKLAAEEFGDFAYVVRMPKNTGSAGGFKAGLEQAMARNADYILLLDDDNKLGAGSVATLRAGYRAELAVGNSGPDNLAMLAFRSHFHLDLAMGVPAERANARPGSFFNFHVLDIPFKIWRRLPMGRKALASQALSDRITLDVAPWGGLFFHRALVERYGYPLSEYIVYTEDYEYIYRMTSQGGRIVLLTNARIEELEPSWITKTRFKSSFDAWLLGADDFRAYYGFRNQTNFEANALPGSRWRWVNQIVYLTIMRGFARLRGRRDRMRLLERALRDGLAGRLGECPEFPL